MSRIIYLSRCTPVYYSAAIDSYFTKNDCGSGFWGSQVYVYFAAGEYTSTASQTDADNIALAAAQDYANANGSCTAYNSNLPALSELTFWSMGSTSTEIATNASENGGGPITERGICYSTVNANPTTSDSKVAISATPESQRTMVTGLTPATNYYWRAYAKNSNGTAYYPPTGFNYPTN